MCPFTLANPFIAPTVSYQAGGKLPLLERWVADSGGLYTSITGTGLSGSVAPSRTGYIDVINDGSNNGRLSTDFGQGGTPSGLTSSGGAAISYIQFDEIQWNNLGLPVSAQVNDPNSYFSTVTLGTYTFNNKSGGGSFLVTSQGENVTFDFSTVTLGTVSAVPEPSTYAAIAGLLALGIVWSVRRRK